MRCRVPELVGLVVWHRAGGAMVWHSFQNECLLLIRCAKKNFVLLKALTFCTLVISFFIFFNFLFYFFAMSRCHHWILFPISELLL